MHLFSRVWCVCVCPVASPLPGYTDNMHQAQLHADRAHNRSSAWVSAPLREGQGGMEEGWLIKNVFLCEEPQEMPERSAGTC